MEHLHHFGLGQDPFSNEPDLRVFFESASHREAQLRVERGLRQRKGLTLLTGEGGMGKSLLARRILDSLEEEVFEAMLLVMLPGAADATGILQRFARQLGVDAPAEDRAGLIGQIYEHLAIVREDGRHTVMIVDDAQVMKPEVLSELGGLLNLEYEDRRLVSILLIGSSELDDLVQDDPGISPRVDVRVRLQPLEKANTAAYILHRLTHVGGRPDLIPGEALDALHKLGGGRPRLLNTLADNALFEAYLAGRTTLDASDIERAAFDLGLSTDPGEACVASPMTSMIVEGEAPELELSQVDSPYEEVLEFPAPSADESSDVLELSNEIFEVEPTLQSNPFLDEEPALQLDEEPALQLDEEPALELEALPEPTPAIEELEILQLEAEPILEASPIEMALIEAEFSTDDAQELEGVFVELIEE